MIVQATNSGYDVGSTQFDLAVSSSQALLNAANEHMLTSPDPWWWIWPLRWLLEAMGRNPRSLGSPVWWI